MITSKQRAQLRGLANGIETIFQIGKSGVNQQLIKQASEALEARELIKLRILETAPESVRDAAETVAQQTGSDVVQVIGTRFILYRESRDNKKINLVK